MGNTSIEWTDKTWSPIRALVRRDAAEIARSKGYTSLVQIAEKMAGHVGPHCERVSHGCDHCYSDTNNGRCLPSNGTGLPFDRRSRDLIQPFMDDHILKQPLSWRKPVKIFVENQSDLFGEWNTDDMIDRVFAIMALCPQHTFQILTKRPRRMLEYCQSERWEDVRRATATLKRGMATEWNWPLDNVWLGISCEDQPTADERIPLLLRTSAAIRFVSYEPALAAVDFTTIPTGRGLGEEYDQVITMNVLSRASVFAPHVNLVIVGGESGPGARPFNVGWAMQTILACERYGAACFVKQLGAKPTRDHNGTCYGKEPGVLMCDWPLGHEIKLKDRKGGDMSEWPNYLRVRQFPGVACAT